MSYPPIMVPHTIYCAGGGGHLSLLFPHSACREITTIVNNLTIYQGVHCSLYIRRIDLNVSVHVRDFLTYFDEGENERGPD